MNNPQKLPPMPTKSGKRIPSSALENILNKQKNMHNLIRIQPQPVSSRRSIDTSCSNEKRTPRCRSSKQISIERSTSADRSTSRSSKRLVSAVDASNLPYITSKSWAVYQMNAGKLIYGKKSQVRQQVASMTKIANLITILDILTEHNLDASKIAVTVTKEAASMIGTTAKLRQGMIFSLQHLFYGMMLPSGNDAAYQIAQLGGTIINLLRDNANIQKVVYNREMLSCAMDKFRNNVIVYLNKMNTIVKFKAKTISTSFANPHGLSNVSSLSTAEDMAKISSYAMQNKTFRMVVETKYYSCKYQQVPVELQNNQNQDPLINIVQNQLIEQCKVKQQIQWQNTNKMLWRGWSGLKTGITPNAGPCLAASFKKHINGKDYQFVVILMRSFSMDIRWKQMEGIAEWTTNLIKKNPI